MEASVGIFSVMAGIPAMVGLMLTAVTIFLTSDWRLSLTGLLVQYVLVGLALTRFIQVEIAIVKVLVGVLVVSILYLSARHAQEVNGPQGTEREEVRFLGLQVGWSAGPLGLPLRLMTIILVGLAVIRFFDDYRLLLPVLAEDNTTVPSDVALVALWLGGVGLMGLVVSGDPRRVAPALLTILAGFDLIYAGLAPNMAIVGLWGALTLLGALAFSYLTIVQGLRVAESPEELESKALSKAVGPEEEGAKR
jgi:hypothetical protein